jgi:hypothetical protein
MSHSVVGIEACRLLAGCEVVVNERLTSGQFRAKPSQPCHLRGYTLQSSGQLYNLLATCWPLFTVGCLLGLRWAAVKSSGYEMINCFSCVCWDPLQP